MFKLSPLLILVTVLTGCATMFAHYRLNDSTTTSIATITPTLNTCVSRGYLPESIASEYLAASTDLLNMSVFDQDLYDRMFSEAANRIHKDSPAEIRTLCQLVTRELPAISADYRRTFARQSHSLAQSRATESATMSQTLNQIDYTNNPVTVPPTPQTQPDFSAFEPIQGTQTQPNDTTHFLINTPDGMYRGSCMNLDSNYHYCQ